jgi:ParB-like chromosome segregation protein Spo0J
MSFASRLAVEWIPLSRIFPNPANPRKNDAAIPHVAASIRRLGFQQPIVAKRSGEVIAGFAPWTAHGGDARSRC